MLILFSEVAGDYHRAIVLNNGTHLCLLSMDILSHNETRSLYCFYQRGTDQEPILFVEVDMDTREIFFATLTSIYRVAINRTHSTEPELVTTLRATRAELRDKIEDTRLIYHAQEPNITGNFDDT